MLIYVENPRQTILERLFRCDRKSVESSIRDKNGFFI